MFNKFALFALAAMVVLPAHAAFAEPPSGPACALSRLASEHITFYPNGMMTIPVSLDNKPQNMVLDLNVVTSAITGDLRESLLLQDKTMSPDLVKHFAFYRGLFVSRTVTIPKIELGKATIPNLKVYVLPTTGAGGVVGMDILRNFDFELDFAHYTLNLFSPDHCAGQGLYWSRMAAVLPFDFDGEGKPRFQMMLDGKPVSVGLSTMTAHARMPMWVAKSLFGIDEDTPGMKLVAGDSHGGIRAFHYPFHALSAEGLTISDPLIDIIEEKGAIKCDGNTHLGLGDMVCTEPDLLLTLDLLARLRFYFALNEKKVYITGFNASLVEASDPRDAK